MAIWNGIGMMPTATMAQKPYCENSSRNRSSWSDQPSHWTIRSPTVSKNR